MYWINPDGEGAFQVWCDQETAGGGWMMLMHIQRGGCNRHSTSAGHYKQSWNDWLNSGIPDVNVYKEVSAEDILDHNSCYQAPFKHWARIAGRSADAGVIDDMVLVGNKGFKHRHTLKDFHIKNGAKFTLGMSNYNTVRPPPPSPLPSL